MKPQASSSPTWLPEQSLDLVYLILLLSTRGRSLDVVVTASLITPDVTPDEVKLYFYSVAPSSINYWSTCRVTVYYTECLTESQKVTIHTFKILSLLTSFINNKYFFWQNWSVATLCIFSSHLAKYGAISDFKDYFRDAGFTTNPEHHAYHYFKPYLGNTEWVSLLIWHHNKYSRKLLLILTFQQILQPSAG